MTGFTVSANGSALAVLVCSASCIGSAKSAGWWQVEDVVNRSMAESSVCFKKVVTTSSFKVHMPSAHCQIWNT